MSAINKIAIIGSGTMGQGIAQVAATNGHEVVLYDNFPGALTKGKSRITSILNRLVEKGRLQANERKAIEGRISYADDLGSCKDCDLVIEAIIEDLEIKKKVFKELESLTRDHCILATNTSSLSVTSIASACENPERVIGIHFFNPAPLMKLVEIIPAIQTSASTTDLVKPLIESWGKTAVLAKDTPGFIVNRVARPFYSEALRLYEEGFADFSTIDWAITEYGGFRMGPFTLMDYIGNDVNYAVTESVFHAFYFDPRYKPSLTQKRFSEAGYLGRKSGRGYYDYSEGSSPPVPNKNESLGRDIMWRILAMLINEAADALYLGIATREDLDLAMTTGVNYPKGLLKWADDVGIPSCVETIDRLYDEYHEDRYRCSTLLRKMSREQKTFY